MATQIDLTKLSIVELKAIAYDLNVLLGRTQQNLQAVVKEMETRNQNPAPNPVENTPTSQN